MVLKKINRLLACSALCSCVFACNVNAAEIKTNMARMQAMDKITGRVNEIDVPVNGEVVFGSFSIVVRSCATRSPEETPENFAFVDVVDNYNTDKPENIFKGWMVSSSPALNAVEHPIYDVWLLKCYDGKTGGKKLLSAEELTKRDSIAKFVDQDNKFNNIEAIETETTETETTVEPAPIDEHKELKEMPIATVEPVIEPTVETSAVAEQPVEDGTPKSLLNLTVEQPVVTEPTKTEENIVDMVVKELQEKETATQPTNVETAEPIVVDAEPLLVVEEPINEVVPFIDTESSEDTINVEEVVESAPDGIENPTPSSDEGQLIKFEDEVEEDGFELNTEALKN